MIYNCNITPPEEIHKYEQPNPNDNYHFVENINGRNLIIPLYIIPYRPPDLSKKPSYHITGYGLYDNFISLIYRNDKPDDLLPNTLAMSKILDYSYQTFNLPEPIKTIKPTCSTFYKYLGEYYNSMDFLNDIKIRTLSRVQPDPQDHKTSEDDPEKNHWLFRHGGKRKSMKRKSMKKRKTGKYKKK